MDAPWDVGFAPFGVGPMRLHWNISTQKMGLIKLTHYRRWSGQTGHSGMEE